MSRGLDRSELSFLPFAVIVGFVQFLQSSLFCSVIPFHFIYFILPLMCFSIGVIHSYSIYSKLRVLVSMGKSPNSTWMVLQPLHPRCDKVPPFSR